MWWSERSGLQVPTFSAQHYVRLVEEAKAARHVLHAAWVKGDRALLVFCFRCGAYEQSLPRHLMLKSTKKFLEEPHLQKEASHLVGFMEQAHPRLRRHTLHAWLPSTLPSRAPNHCFYATWHRSLYCVH